MPPDGVVDARQPHPLNSLDPQGISKIVVMGPAGASRSCWDLCDSSESSLNSIDKVVEGPAGTYSIELLFPISAYAVTTITYLGNGATGRFTSHPGNVNGDAGSGPLDVLNIIDCLNGVNQAVTCPWGFPYSQDLDHSGGFGPSDILREIDVLNGADLLTPANGTNLPMQVPCF